MNEAVIVAAARSPIGRAHKGSLVALRPDDLAAQVARAALARVPALDLAELEDVLVGCAQPAGEAGYNLGRIVALLLGRDDLPGTTVHRYCASSLSALRHAVHAIRAGEGDAFLVVGVETVSRFGRGKADGHPDTQNPALPGAYVAMGLTAENVAAQAGITRHEMDLYAARSQAYAARAVERGFFAAEIAPISTPDGAVVTRDDCPRPDTTLDKLAALKPAFREDGTVTAGNACPLNDGAAALVVLSERRAAQLGLAPLGRVVCSAISALDPALMGLGPVEATRRALARAGLALPDLELVEMNEAFAAQVLASARALELPLDRLNVNGGAIALGHPFGMTGARLVQTLLHALAERRARYGLATLCAAGGQGLSMVLERLT